MFKILGMRSWNLNAGDLEEMVGFYRDKLGVEESGRQTIAGASVVELDGTESRMVPLRLRVQPGAASTGAHPIEFEVSAVGVEGVSVREKSVFLLR